MKIAKAFLLYHNSPLSISKMLKACSYLDEHQVDYIRFCGYTPYPFDDNRVRLQELQKHAPYQIKSYEHGESECTLGHFKIWEFISYMPKSSAYVVLEDDAITKVNFSNLNINVSDNEIVFLGPRALNELDYDFPRRIDEIKKIKIDSFFGAHAYAITPRTAAMLMQDIQLQGLTQTVDGVLGINNSYKLTLNTIEPPVVICTPGPVRTFNNEPPELVNAYITKTFYDQVQDRYEQQAPELLGECI